VAAQTILVVDDDIQTLTMLQLAFEAEGYAVLTASDGQQGISEALHNQPDLIISDVMMPDVDGFELCQTLKHRPETQAVPIILVSAKGETSSIIEGFRQGADEYITKPFNFQEVLVRVERLLRWVQKDRGASEISGNLAATPLFELLHFCEEHRISGDLRLTRQIQQPGYETMQQQSTVHLHLGEITRIDLDDIHDVAEALDALLEWNEGTFTIEQAGPQLPTNGHPGSQPSGQAQSDQSQKPAGNRIESERASRLAHLRNILNDLQTELDAEDTFAFVVMDGTILNADTVDVEPSEIGEILTTLMESTTEVCQIEQQSQLTECVIKAEQGVIALYPIETGITLAISASSEVNLGILNLLGRQAVGNIERVLDEVL
jgi:DNA-binding response OmpR family regulator/predicted regulator of Ras-like GTPase activity (Roadblock/LC7/MglB family)